MKINVEYYKLDTIWYLVFNLITNGRIATSSCKLTYKLSFSLPRENISKVIKKQKWKIINIFIIT